MIFMVIMFRVPTLGRFAVVMTRMGVRQRKTCSHYKCQSTQKHPQSSVFAFDCIDVTDHLFPLI